MGAKSNSVEQDAMVAARGWMQQHAIRDRGQRLTTEQLQSLRQKLNRNQFFNIAKKDE